VGLCDASYNSVGVWVKPPFVENNPEDESFKNEYQKGFVYYLNLKNQIVGVLLIGMSDTLKDKIMFARKVLRRKRKNEDLLSVQQAIVVEEWPEYSI
jgi:hypothetical protein